MGDRRLNEARERLYDRARRDGFSRGESAERAQRAYDDVARKVDQGRVKHPDEAKG